LRRYLSLENDFLISLRGDRLTFGLRDDRQVKDASADKDLEAKGRLWLEETGPGLKRAIRDASRDDPHLEHDISLVQAVTHILRISHEEWPVPILLVKGEFLRYG